MRVAVLDTTKKPLAPATPRRARLLLKKGKAAVFRRYRDQLPDAIAESFDALCTLHLPRDNDNPLFGRRGRPGDKVNADIAAPFMGEFAEFEARHESK